MNNETLKNIFPFGLLLLLMIAQWMGLPELGMAANAGFIGYALFRLYESIKNKYYKQFNLNILRVIFSVLIILTAFDNIRTGQFASIVFPLILFCESFILRKMIVLRQKNSD